jgi:hypothetical protein
VKFYLLIIIVTVICFTPIKANASYIDSIFTAAATHSSNGLYKEAIQLLDSTTSLNQPYFSNVFKAIILLQQYDDLGDTANIASADSLLLHSENMLSAKFYAKDSAAMFWLSLAKLQRGYIKEINGSSISAGIAIRSAANDLAKLSFNSDATAFYAIYAYYMNSAFSWLPFSKTLQYIKIIEKQAESSSCFSTYFTHTLAWIYYEEKNFLAAESLMLSHLDIYPDNRISKQNLADFLIAKKEYPKAYDIYKATLLEYENLAPLRIRHLSAMANLAYIHYHTGNFEEAKTYLTPFKDAELKPIIKRLPPTLVDSLKTLPFNIF